MAESSLPSPTTGSSIEYLDVVDENTGELTGERLSRKQIHLEGHWHRVIHGMDEYPIVLYVLRPFSSWIWLVHYSNRDSILLY